MASSELDLMKEIPGYKLILKTVLKGQIQQLVQQLALHTDEESVLLTACVGDGAVTVSSLGSDIGKMFLGDHEDIKSQFIGFCLKNHHNFPLQKDESTIDNDPFVGPCNLPLSPKVVSPKQGGVLTRSSPKQRHEPYPVKRSSSRQAYNIEKSARQTEGKMVSIKQEKSSTGPNDSISNVEIGNPESVESLTGPTREQCEQSEKKGEIFENQFAYQNEATFQREAEKDNSDNSNTSSPENSKIVPVTPESLFVNSCFTSSLPLDTAQRENRSQSGCNSDIKLEAISESEMELEITGTVPGNGNAKVKKSLSLADVTLSPKSAGATSGYEDLARQVPQNLELVSGQLVGEGMSPVRVHICDICRKPFPSKWELSRHRRTHTGEKPYTCEYCNKAFSDKSNMNQHIKGVHFRQPFRKDNLYNKTKTSLTLNSQITDHKHNITDHSHNVTDH